MQLKRRAYREWLHDWGIVQAIRIQSHRGPKQTEQDRESRHPVFGVERWEGCVLNSENTF